MQFTEYGCPTGKPVVYFHGVPGAPSEAAVLHHPALQQGLRVLCFERFTVPASNRDAAYYRQIAAAIREVVENTTVDFVGFSMGTHVALACASCMQAQVVSLHLVSAVAPLQAGDFLDAMAGKAVFNLAQKRPWLFKLLARWQEFLSRRAAAALFRLLFASAQGQDKQLASQADFQQFIASTLADCFRPGVEGYSRDIEQYLSPWAVPVFAHEPPIYLWHGSEDNWSPIAMAEHLAATLPCATLQRGAGLSHYSCLYDAAPKICEVIGVRP